MDLKYVQIETTTTCNQRCYFCPVSTGKRPKSKLSLAQIQKIIEGLRAYPIEAIFISGFNEPTLDKQIIEKVAAFRQANFAVHFYTNGSGLKPALIDELLKLGISGFTINLSTLDEKQYQQTRGTQDVKNLVSYLDYLFTQVQEQNLSTKITILILGRLDLQHAINVQKITEQFAYSPVPKITILPVAEYAGKSTQVLTERPYHKTLRGCAMARQNQWLHFTADGSAILCCHDYFAQYKMGHISDATVSQIYHSQKITQWRQWISGAQEAPTDFICRQCVFALTEDNYANTLKKLFCQNCQLPNICRIENACQRCEVNLYL